MAASSSRSNMNKILASIDDAEYRDFFSQLESVSLIQGEVIYEAEGTMDYVYFPETAVFSMLSTMEDGRTVEVGPVGDEGLVGLRIFLGAEHSLDQVMRQRQLVAGIIAHHEQPAGKLLLGTVNLVASPRTRCHG